MHLSLKYFFEEASLIRQWNISKKRKSPEYWLWFVWN